ncbi:hypothetical protein AB0L05_41995, partial [Nonomuraea pusilla]|uniref:hypothetical protein n=1 Tax=Nonomuraea pusilla TaxID=46177 RepID=UPI00332B9F28
ITVFISVRPDHDRGLFTTHDRQSGIEGPHEKTVIDPQVTIDTLGRSDVCGARFGRAQVVRLVHVV